jgi:hypothetical protein
MNTGQQLSQRVSGCLGRGMEAAAGVAIEASVLRRIRTCSNRWNKAGPSSLLYVATQ